MEVEFGQSHWPRVMGAGFISSSLVSLVSLVLVVNVSGIVVGDKERALVAVMCRRMYK